MNGIAVILHNVKHPSNNVKYLGISDTFDVKMMALKQLSVVVVSNLVALVALIVSYPILLLTNNNMMMISVGACLKKIAN